MKKITQSNKTFPKKISQGPSMILIFFRAFNLNSYSSLRILFIYSAKLHQFKNVKKGRKKQTNNNLLGQQLHVRHNLDNFLKTTCCFTFVFIHIVPLFLHLDFYSCYILIKYIFAVILFFISYQVYIKYIIYSI